MMNERDRASDPASEVHTLNSPESTQDRRTFLRQSGLIVSAATVGVGTPTPVAASASQTPFEPALLRAVGALVLPTELNPDALEGAVRDFEAWAIDFEPVAELNHGYGTSEIRYGPPDPVPGWNAQLAALDLEARQRHDLGFDALDETRARDLLNRQVRAEGPSMPAPLRAEHVALALMAHWFSSADAVDRCYASEISPRTCRGLDASADEPGRHP